METNKIHIYFVPGLAASSQIFEFIQLPKEKFELHFIEWLIPLTINEPLEEYAKRMAAKITEKNPVLIGVSFGGILVQEMSKYLQPQKTIIISSVKSNQELPKRLKLLKHTHIYKFFPAKYISNFENYAKYLLGDFAKKRIDLYHRYLSVRDENYLNWAIKNVLNWKQQKPLKNCIHIHGNQDQIFPIKHINNAIEIDKGTHAMIIYKAKTISKILANIFQ
jgi:pimeloyl-ACP methyl ester carboxylesterase